MGFFDALSRGWEMTKASLKIVSMDTELLILPLISGIIMIAIVASFLFPILLGTKFEGAYEYVTIGVVYLVSFFLLYFSQAMIVESARKRLEGHDPTLGDSFSTALKYWDKILLLSIIGAVIGVLISMLRNKRGGGAGESILSSIIGVAWTVASYFSIPVILNENLGVFESFSRSTNLVKKAWGTGIAANISLAVILLPFVALLILTFIAFLYVPVLGIPLAILALIALLAGTVLQSVAKGIISQVLYLYATTGSVPKLFPEEAVKNFYSASNP